MKKLLVLLLALVSLGAQAQFTPGTVLTAAALNAALATPTITNGTITGLTAPLPATLGGLGVRSPAINAVLVGNGSGAVQTVGPGTTGQMLIGVSGSAPAWGNNPTISGGTITNSPISGSTGSFTTLSASSTVSGAGFSTYLASPPAIGATAPGTGAFTTLSTTGLATLNSLTTANATITGGSINGAPVGATTASTGAFTTLAASSTVSGAGFSTYLASPPAIGGTAPAGGSFTTLSASSTVSGAGFSTYLASPPAIGTTTPAAGKFTTLQATSAITPSSTAGIAGTTTNDDANAGSVGEFPTPTNLSGVSLTSGTAANVSSISLAAGDYEISGVARFNPGGSATTSNMSVGISTTSATFPSTLGTFTANLIPFGSVAGGNNVVPSPTVRIKLASTTTVYLVALCTFSASTMTADGSLHIRRPR